MFFSAKRAFDGSVDSFALVGQRGRGLYALQVRFWREIVGDRATCVERGAWSSSLVARARLPFIWEYQRDMALTFEGNKAHLVSISPL